MVDPDLGDVVRKPAGSGNEIALIDGAAFESAKERKTAFPGQRASDVA